MKHVLIVDDDERLRQLLKRYLQKHDYQVSSSADAKTAEKLMQGMNFDLLIVDVMMPGEDGISFVARMRPDNAVPIIMLTAKSDVEDRLRGLEAGVDDFVAKPFEPRELLLRMDAVLRRVKSPTVRRGIVVFGDYHLDLESGRLAKGAQKIELTRNERDILGALANAYGEVVSRDDLLGVLGESGSLRNVDVTITRLRKKIETNPKQPQFIHTVRGVGYRVLANS